MSNYPPPTEPVRGFDPSKVRIEAAGQELKPFQDQPGKISLSVHNYAPPPGPINGPSGKDNLSKMAPRNTPSRDSRQNPFCLLKGAKIPGLPQPHGPVKGVTYSCARGSGDDRGRLILSWTSHDKEQWRLVLERVRALPARSFNPATKLWDVPDKPAYVAWLVASGWTIPSVEPEKAPAAPLPVPPDPAEEQAKRIKAVQLEPCRPLIPGLYPYQVDFVRFMSLRKGRAALGDDMGTGKTVQALAWLAYSGAFPALIVVNAPTKLQWARAFNDWLSKVQQLNPMFRRIGVLWGRKPFAMEPGVSYIINWDILADWAGHLAGNGQFIPDGPLAKFGFQLLIGDECQAIGNPTSKRSKAFRAMSRVIPGLIGMSGTPARSKPAQFWPLLNILSPDKFPNYHHYLNRYCGPKSNGFGMTYNGASHIQELHRMLVDVMVRRTKAQVMKDLPPKTVDVIPLEPDQHALAEYQAAETEAFSGDVSKAELRERVAGLLRSAYSVKEKPAMEWIRNFLEATDNKLLIFAWHRDVVDLVTAEMSEYNAAKLYGGMSTGDRDKAVSKFTTDSKCRVMVANIQAGGVGIDGFQHVCSYCVFLEFSHTPNDHRQAEDRLHRGGQGVPVNSYYLVAKGTIDMDAIEVLDQRAKMLDGVMDGKAPVDMDLLTEILARRGRS